MMHLFYSELLKKIWDMNSATRKAVRQISNTTTDTIPVVTAKTSEVSSSLNSFIKMQL